jgi:hypothetical protein
MRTPKLQTRLDWFALLLLLRLLLLNIPHLPLPFPRILKKRTRETINYFKKEIEPSDKKSKSERAPLLRRLSNQRSKPREYHLLEAREDKIRQKG